MPPVHRLLHRVLDTTQAPQADDGKAQGVLRDPARSRGRLTGKTVSILYEANEVCNMASSKGSCRKSMFQSSTRLTRFATGPLQEADPGGGLSLIHISEPTRPY